MSKDWSTKEVELIVKDYFLMLQIELSRGVIKKSEHRRFILPLLNNRSEASIEFKHRNISAVLVSTGIPFIRGYKPLYNFQKSLITEIDLYRVHNKQFDIVLQNFTDLIPDSVQLLDFNNWEVPAPDRITIPAKIKNIVRRAVKVDYLEREQCNRNLGLKGEELVMEYEISNLKNMGHSRLADQVEWVSKEQGDGLGYDILSKNVDGSDKYIEVKSTKLSKEAPFFFSSNELSFSNENSDNFYLYRIFELNSNPKMFKLKGRYEDFCNMEPVLFKGRF